MNSAGPPGTWPSGTTSIVARIGAPTLASVTPSPASIATWPSAVAPAWLPIAGTMNGSAPRARGGRPGGPAPRRAEERPGPPRPPGGSHRPQGFGLAGSAPAPGSQGDLLAGANTGQQPRRIESLPDRACHICDLG